MSSHKRILLGIKELGEKFEKLVSKQDTKEQQRQEHLECINQLIEKVQDDQLQFKSFMLEERDKREEMWRYFEGKVNELRKAAPLTLTTGPVIRSDLVDNLYVEVLNNTDTPQNVRITLYDLSQYPKQQVEDRVVTVQSTSALSELFEIGPEGLGLQRFEVQIKSLDGTKEGIFIYIAGIRGSNLKLIQSNVFRHEQLIPVPDL